MTLGLPFIASPIFALLSTENPQVMIATGGILCAIFGGVINMLDIEGYNVDCNLKHVYNWIGLFVFMYNATKVRIKFTHF
jgi:hypothetical protein